MNSFFKGLLYSSFLLVIVFLFVLGNQQTNEVPNVSNNWFQDFSSSILLKRSEAFVERIDEVSLRKEYYNYRNHLAYYNRTGEITYQLRLDENNFFSSSDDYYLLYQKVGEFVRLYTKTGEEVWSLATFGYPHISPLSNMIMILSSDNSFISLYDLNKNLLQSKTYLGSLVTDFKFSSFDGSLLLGTMDSRLFYYDHSGELVFAKDLTDSRFNYVKTTYISNQGNYLLAINGLQPEYLTVLNKTGEILWQRNTLIERRHLSFPYIDEINENLFDLRNNKIHVLDLKGGEPKEIIDLGDLALGALGDLEYALMASNQSHFGVALVSSNGRWLLIFNEKYEIIWQKSFLDEFFIYFEMTPVSNDDSFDVLIHSNEGIYFYHIG